MRPTRDVRRREARDAGEVPYATRVYPTRWVVPALLVLVAGLVSCLLFAAGVYVEVYGLSPRSPHEGAQLRGE